MKKNLLQLSFTSLLLASSSIPGQATDTENTLTSPHLSETQSTSHRFDQYQEKENRKSDLMLATAVIYTDNENAGRLDDIIAEHSSKQTEAGIETAQTEYFSEEELKHLRKLFLQAESSVKKNRKAEYIRVSDQLKKYPLLPYLQYQWLKKHLDDEEQIKQFLQQHGSSRYAGKLTSKWLYHLAKRKQWPLFLQFYSTSDDTRLNCYHHLAEFNTGDKQAALEGAKNLWVVGRSQPRQCDPLFEKLMQSGLFTQELRWQRFAAALQNNKVSLAVYIKGLMPKTEQVTAQLWINLHRKPSHYMQQLLDQANTAQSAINVQTCH